MITSHKLSKRYGEINVVDNVSININKGEIYGFIGLNGAGKTTTMRMLLGMIKSTSGYCSVNGEKITPKSYDLWSKLGYMIETPNSYPQLTVHENLKLAKRYKKVDNKFAIDEMLELLELKKYARLKAKNLSLGNKQRLGLAKALIHNPEILILDEPTNGLDPEGIQYLRKMFLNLADKGVTLMISSHILDELGKYASRIGIIHNGKLMIETDAHELKSKFAKYVVVATKNQQSCKEVLNKNGYLRLDSRNGNINVYDQKALESPELISQLLVNNGLPPSTLAINEENLETYFFNIIGNKNHTA